MSVALVLYACTTGACGKASQPVSPGEEPGEAPVVAGGETARPRAPATTSYTPTEEVLLKEAVYRGMMEEFWRRPKDKEIVTAFLIAEQGEERDYLAKQLQTLGFPVKRRSAVELPPADGAVEKNAGVVDNETGQTAVLLRVRILEIDGLRAVAEGFWYAGVFAAGKDRYVLQKGNDGWHVVEKKVLIIS
jgi:hypothetical protein